MLIIISPKKNSFKQWIILTILALGKIRLFKHPKILEKNRINYNSINK
jgi:hypothetical protein